MDRSTLEIFFIIDRRRDTTIHFKVVFLRPLFLQGFNSSIAGEINRFKSKSKALLRG